MNKKQKIIIIVGIIFALLLITGGSYAFWFWTSNVNKNVTFNTADLEKNIVYNEGDAKFIGNFQPTSTFCESAHNTISFYKKSDLQVMDVSASIKMQVNSIGENIASSNDVYWIVTIGDSNITCDEGLSSSTVVASGNFNGVTNGQILELYSDIEVELTEQVYTVWIWIDSNGTDLSNLSGETIDTNMWTDFEMKGYKGFNVNFDANGGLITSLGGGDFEFFSYMTSGEHVFEVPYHGVYKLETWGAQGGSSLGNGSIMTTGGYGGYATGFINLIGGQKLYVNVGGKGSDGKVSTNVGGGYNGGGSGTSDGADDESSGGGGGATHIATKSGLLSSLSDSLENILIVSGGGGGASWNYSAGSGGGINGGTTGGTSSSYPNQISGYAFGKGQNASGSAESDGVGGGGGGYYGGYSNNVGGKSSGTGGSGYIGNNLLTDKAMYCFNCTESTGVDTLTYSTTNVSSDAVSNYAKSGDGAASITLLELELEKLDLKKVYGDKYGDLPVPEKYGYAFMGWYTELEGGELITKDTIFNSIQDVTLYAHWDKLPTYTISYDVNGGEGEIESQIKVYGETLILSSDIPTKEGYVLSGWATDSNATSATYKIGGNYLSNVSVTLYAVWRKPLPFESHSCANSVVGSEPYSFTYTGNCQVINDGDENWRIKFLTTGSFTTSDIYVIDAFLVGGGGGGQSGPEAYQGGIGGGGGYTITDTISLVSGEVYSINIGGGGGANTNGGATTAFNLTANGGYSGSNGGAGGSGGGGYGLNGSLNGGRGGSNGGNGIGGGNSGVGQGSTTCEFGEDGCENDKLYAGGGGGGNGWNNDGASSPGGGGAGGGGNAVSNNTGGKGTDNRGGGGAGGGPWATGGAGGSGVVVIRNNANIRVTGTFPGTDVNFGYSGSYTIHEDGNGNWRVKFLSSGRLVVDNDIDFDVFLVGGGGGGQSGPEAYQGGIGGGGGYTTTNSVTAKKYVQYDFHVGSGGRANLNGETTIAFDFTALGGYSGLNGGAGGSGGGGYGLNGSLNGGRGGSNGGNGIGGGNSGVGQGSTTCEFGEDGCENDKLYAGGGGGGNGWNNDGASSPGGGGAGGGGNAVSNNTGGKGTDNKGGGGAGGGPWATGGQGGSGIIIIRNKR